jgi:hypothetical protein
MSGKMPFTVKPFSDVGTGEPFLARIALGLADVLDGTDFDNKQEIKEAILSLVFDCLIPAFMSLRELRMIAMKKDVPELTKAKNFDDMYKYLWGAYKDRLPKIRWS